MTVLPVEKPFFQLDTLRSFASGVGWTIKVTRKSPMLLTSSVVKL